MALPRPKAFVSHAEVGWLQEPSLRLVVLGGDDEVIMYDGKLVQYQDMRRFTAWYAGDEQV